MLIEGQRVTHAGLFVSTHYPSAVLGDQGTPVYYQQQVLATAARSAFGR